MVGRATVVRQSTISQTAVPSPEHISDRRHVDQSELTTTPAEQLIFQITGVFAEFELSMSIDCWSKYKSTPQVSSACMVPSSSIKERPSRSIAHAITTGEHPAQAVATLNHTHPKSAVERRLRGKGFNAWQARSAALERRIQAQLKGAYPGSIADRERSGNSKGAWRRHRYGASNWDRQRGEHCVLPANRRGPAP